MGFVWNVEMDDIKRFLKSPNMPKVVLGVSILVGMHLAKVLARSKVDGSEKVDFATWYKREYEKGQKERREMRAKGEQQSKQIEMIKIYFDAEPGANLLEDALFYKVKGHDPISDTIKLPILGGFRECAFIISSESRNARLDVRYDVADRAGGMQLFKNEERIWRMSFGIRDEKFIEWGRSGSDESGPYVIDSPSARLALSMLISSDNTPTELHLLKGSYFRIRTKLWNEYLAANPDIADEYSRL
jgi:hypothetical protein